MSFNEKIDALEKRIEKLETRTHDLEKEVAGMMAEKAREKEASSPAGEAAAKPKRGLRK